MKLLYSKCSHFANTFHVGRNHMYTLIIEDWEREQIPLNGPISEADIAAYEAAIEFCFPDDFKQFYKICNGFSQWQMDSKMLSLWSLQMIVAENRRHDFIAFADYNVNGSQIGYRRDRPGVFHDYHDVKFCDSFEEFLEHWRLESGVYI